MTEGAMRDPMLVHQEDFVLPIECATLYGIELSPSTIYGHSLYITKLGFLVW